MPTWSTDALPAAERFPFWREVRAKNLFGVSVELDPARHATFRGIFSAEPIAMSSLVELHASPYSVKRTIADIGRAPGNSICIYQQIRGGAWFSTAKGAEFTVSAGNIATSHTDLTYATRPTTNEGFHLRILKVPFKTCESFVRREGDLSPQPLNREHRFSALLSFYFASFLAQVSQLTAADREAAVLGLAQIALAVRGLVAVHDEPMRAAVRNGRLTCARELIAQNFHRAELSPSMVAGMLGISVRQLHLLFEPTGVSFARYLMSKRLAHACSLLSQFVQRPVSSIAFSCGFDSLATFYRAFRNAFGVSPTDYRQSVIGKA